MKPNTSGQIIASIVAKETKRNYSYINITLKWLKDNENDNQLI